jgi:hypothetical protein
MSKANATNTPKTYQQILKLLEVIEVQRDALDKAHDEVRDLRSGDCEDTLYEALTKTDAMLGELIK